jgi:hypothetical protein
MRITKDAAFSLHLFHLSHTMDDSIILEFSRPFLWPAFDHNFRLSKEFHGMLALPMQRTKEAVLPSAEWEECHGCRHPNIDPNIPGIGFITELARC